MKVNMEENVQSPIDSYLEETTGFRRDYVATCLKNLDIFLDGWWVYIKNKSLVDGYDIKLSKMELWNIKKKYKWMMGEIKKKF